MIILLCPIYSVYNLKQCSSLVFNTICFLYLFSKVNDSQSFNLRLSFHFLNPDTLMSLKKMIDHLKQNNTNLKIVIVTVLHELTYRPVQWSEANVCAASRTSFKPLIKVVIRGSSNHPKISSGYILIISFLIPFGMLTKLFWLAFRK